MIPVFQDNQGVGQSSFYRRIPGNKMIELLEIHCCRMEDLRDVKYNVKIFFGSFD